MLAQGLVLLSAADTDAPSLPAVATVSKDDDWDDGGRALGAASATNGAVWCDRPYFTGTPTAAWLLERVDRALGAGCAACQIGNELNLDLEGWQGGAASYDALYADVRAARPQATLLYQPPSPGVPGWEAWVATDAPAYGVHAYGTFLQMQGVVRWYLDNTAGELWVTEINPGAGQSFDLDAWATTELVDFLDWCAGEARVRFVSYFAWRWNESASLPSSVDAAESAVPDVLAAWTPPIEGGAGEEWYPAAVQRPIARNYTPGRGGHTPRATVAHIADGDGSLYNWFQNPQAQASAHFWVSKAGVVEQYRPVSDCCWANGPLCAPDLTSTVVADIVAAGADPNQVTIAVEHEGRPGHLVPEEQVAAAGALVAWLAERFGYPRDREHLLGHDQFDSCTRASCPGPTYPYAAVLGSDAGAGIAAVRDEVWALADQVEAAGYPWYGQALKSATALSKGER